MGRHTEFAPRLIRYSGVRAVAGARSGHPNLSHPLFAFCIALAIIMVTIIAPDSSASAASGAFAPIKPADVQHVVASGGATAAVVRDSYGASKPVVRVRTAPAVGKPDPGTAQAIAYDLLMSRGMAESEYGCLVALWNRESGWNVYAQNRSSGAYGIPQALPGSKMASAGADWATNPKTQILWGLSYVSGRYGTPCGAWASFQSKGWY